MLEKYVVFEGIMVMKNTILLMRYFRPRLIYSPNFTHLPQTSSHSAMPCRWCRGRIRISAGIRIETGSGHFTLVG